MKASLAQSFYFYRMVVFIGVMVLSLIGSLQGFSQDDRISTLADLSPEQYSGEQYARAIRNYRDSLISLKQYQAIQIFDDYVDELESYEFDQKSSIRKAYTRHAKAYDKYLGDLFQAEKYYLKAHLILSKDEVKDDAWAWFVENPLAIINNQLGDIDKSLYYYEIAQEAMEKQDRIKLCRLLGNKGILMQSQLKYSQARKTYNQGLKLAKKFDYALGDAMNRINLNALNIVEGKVDEAKLQLDTIKELLINPEIKYKIYNAYLNQIADLALIDNDLESSIAYNKRQLQFLDSIYSSPYRREYAKLYNKLAKAYLKNGDVRQAKQSIRQGLKSIAPDTDQLFINKAEVYEENTFMELYGTLARLFAFLYDTLNQRQYLDSALLAYDYALYVNELIVGLYDTDASKYFVAYTNKQECEGLIDVVWKLKEIGDPISDDQLIQYLQAYKSLVFDDALKQRMTFEQLLPEDQSKYVSCQVKLSKLQTNYELAEIDKSEQKLKIHEEIASLVNKVNVELDVIQTPLINYIVTSGNIYCVDNISDELRLTRLCSSSTIEKLQREYSNLMINVSSDGQIEKVGNEIFNELLKPLGELPSLFSIIPDDYLFHLPFDALKDDAGRWLIEKHRIDYRQSMKTTSLSDRSFDRILCVRPNYGPTNHLIAYNRSDIYPLKYSYLEEEALKGYFKNTEVRKDLNIDDLPSDLLHTDIFHFSGHARADNRQGKLIFDADQRSISGSEIARFPSNLQLAVLSGCETGLGEIKYGEGSMSLARSFLSGGTKHVVNSLWTVNDQTTAQLMQFFYSQLQSLKDPIDALRYAKLEYLKKAENEAIHPYYWTGFVVSTTVSMSSGYKWEFFFLAGLVLFAIVYFVYQKTSS